MLHPPELPPPSISSLVIVAKWSDCDNSLCRSWGQGFAIIHYLGVTIKPFFVGRERDSYTSGKRQLAVLRKKRKF